MDVSEFMTDRGMAIGLGRVKIPKMPKLGFDFEIPLLSFIVVQKGDGGGYVATCIHLQTDGYGSTREKAIDCMVSNVWYFLHENFKPGENMDGAWDNLLDIFKANRRCDALWDKYHALQIGFAKRGITTDRYSELHEKIQLLENKVRKLEDDICEKEAFISEMMDNYISEIMGSAVIEYDER
jgi:hypothetical protein